MTKPRSWLAAEAGVLVAAVAAAYANSLQGAFVFDDPSSIANNRTIRHLADLGAVLRTPHATVTAEGRPVLNLSLAINYALGGTNVLGYHLLNVAFHAAAALALLGLLRRTFRRLPRLAPQAEWLATAVAVLWAVHPLQTESVTYVIQRAESLMGLFYLLTLYAFLRGTEASPSAWFAAAVAACFAGMATKEDMVSAPVAVLLYDALLVAGSIRAALRRRWGLYAGLAASWGLLAWLIAFTGGNRGGSVGFGLKLDWFSYWLTQFPAVSRYLALSFWPHPLVFEYGTFWLHRLTDVWPQALLVAALAAGTVWALRRAPAAGWAGFCFFAILAPTSLVPGTTQMIVEHRMYLPLASVLGVAVGGLAAAETAWRGRLGRRPVAWATLVLAAAAAAGAIAVTRARNEDYRDAVRLWELTVRQRPDNVLARTMLGDALRQAGDPDAALVQYERAVALNPGFALGQDSLGEMLVRRGRLREAAGHFRAALRSRPQYADAYNNLGAVLARLGERQEALADLRRAIALKPDYSAAHENLAKLLAEEGDPAAAAGEYRRALAWDPGSAAAHAGLARQLGKLNRLAEAEAEFAAALRCRPRYPEAEYDWGVLLTQAGRLAEAVTHYEAAIRLDPAYLDARDNLAEALFQLGRWPDAAAACREALRRSPHDAYAQRTLEQVRRAEAGLPP